MMEAYILFVDPSGSSINTSTLNEVAINIINNYIFNKVRLLNTGIQ